jgi:uncharacterized protein YjbI with pentapeptide repeats
MTCSWLFVHPDAPLPNCNLPSGPDGLCIFHSPSFVPDFVREFSDEVARPRHWLEGARIKTDIVGILLSGAKLPYANFEGRHLIRVALDRSLLEGANFRGAVIEGVVLNGSNLRRAAFDRAILRPDDTVPVDLRDTELGGVSLTGAKLRHVRLHGAHFSEQTEVSHLIESPTFEMHTGAWDHAATIYSVIGRRAAEDWDSRSEQTCSFLAMTCRHRRAIVASPLSEGWSSQNWLKPTLSAGLPGIAWALHREGWGYGLSPFRVFGTMIAVILSFGLFVFPFAGLTHVSHTPEQDHASTILTSLILSLNTFVTLTYGRHVPATTFGEVAGGIEALLANILMSLFLVSLTAKYMRRV